MPDYRSFRSRIEETVSISRWVAGSTSTHRWVFLAHLNDTELLAGQQPATHALYALKRYRSHHQNPLEEYSFSRRVPRHKSARLTPAGAKAPFTSMTKVPLNLLLGNPEVVAELQNLFDTVDHDDFVSANTRGTSSLFDVAYHVPDVLVEPLAAGGLAEVMTTIFCNNVEDLRLHSLFRVHEPRTEPVVE